MRVLLFSLVAILCWTATAAVAQAPVEVNHAGNDPLGKQAAYQLRQLLQENQSYRISSSGPRYEVLLHSIDPSSDDVGNKTVVAAIITIESEEDLLAPWLVQSTIYEVGRKRMDDLAFSLADLLGETVDDIGDQPLQTMQPE